MIEETGTYAVEIIVVDVLKYGSSENNVKDLDYKFVKGDIGDYDLMGGFVEKADAQEFMKAWQLYENIC